MREIHHKCVAVFSDPELASFSYRRRSDIRRIQNSTQVSGHEFTHAAKAAQKTNLLAAAGPGSPARAAFAHARAEAPSRSLRPQAETLSEVEGVATK